MYRVLARNGLGLAANPVSEPSQQLPFYAKSATPTTSDRESKFAR